MTMTRSGQFNRRITLRSLTSTPDGGGGHTETPTDLSGIYARIEPLEGRELVEAMQTGLLRPHRITIRYRTDVTGANLLLYDGRTFDIKSIVDPDERHRELHILADEGPAYFRPLENTAVLVLAGTEQEAETLTLTPGTWAGDEPITVAHQWYAADDASGLNEAAISGATGLTLELLTGHVGKFIRVKETATETAGDFETSSVFSDYTGEIQPTPLSRLSSALAAAGFVEADWRLYDSTAGLAVSSGVVDSWADRLGRSGAWTFSGTARPARTLDAINGHPALTFDGVNDGSSHNSALAGFVRNVNGVVLSSVASTGAVPKADASLLYFSGSTSANSTRLRLGRNSSDGAAGKVDIAGRRQGTDPIAFIVSGVSSSAYTSQTAIADYGNAVLRFYQSAAELSGSPLAPFQTAGNVADTASLDVTMGRGFSVFFAGAIAGAFMLRRASGSADLVAAQAAIDAYWKELYGAAV